MKNFKNSVFILGEEISENISAEKFKKSGDMLLATNGSIALYLYRHSIELQFKSLLKRFNAAFEPNYTIETLFNLLKIQLNTNNILNNEETIFLNELISDYISLDKKATKLRYSNNNTIENLTISENFINKNILNNVDNPYLYEIKEKESKCHMDQLFIIFFNIEGWIDNNLKTY